MYGFGILVPNYYEYSVELFNTQVRVSLLATIFMRLVVGIGWFGMLRKAHKPGWWGLIPLWGELQVFRIIYDDFAFAAVFAGSTAMAWVGSLGVQHGIVSIFWFVNGLLWWILCFFTCVTFKVSYVFWPIYAIVPWAGALFFGFHDLPRYSAPWDPHTPVIPDRKAEREKAERRLRIGRKNRGKGKR